MNGQKNSAITIFAGIGAVLLYIIGLAIALGSLLLFIKFLIWGLFVWQI